MKKLFFIGALVAIFSLSQGVFAHCQMPCGIYHDDMVYDMLDQYVETMYKGISVLNQNKFKTVHDQNELIRWIVLKEKESDDMAKLITTYFLQQKIKPDDVDSTKQVLSAHKLLFLLVAIKQNTDLKFVKAFAQEWKKFKKMFHVEGYQCKVEMLQQQKEKEEEEKEAMEKQSSEKQ